MTISPHPGRIRHLVRQTFRQFWAEEEEINELEENLLVQEGRYYARSYRIAGFMAMWMIEIGLLQFYDSQGNMLMTVNLFQEDQPHRMAA